VVSTRAEPVCLVACPSCHAQFDTAGVRGESFLCHCGARVANARPKAIDAPIKRCSACGAQVQAGAEKCTYCGSILAGAVGRLVCPECFARNPGGARFCGSCGVAFRPQPVVAAGEPVSCPVCAVHLTPRSLAGLAIQECPTCRGLWVPTANFDALVEHAREHRAPEPTAGIRTTPLARPEPSRTVAYRKCPVCTQMMNRKNFARISGVIVDWCRPHGTWLDASELEQIATFVGHGGMERAARQEQDDERVAASMRVIERIPQGPPAMADEHASHTIFDLLIHMLS
jgi:Zn-finger nucleic acid-binding protein/ribosomal protein L40E